MKFSIFIHPKELLEFQGQKVPPRPTPLSTTVSPAPFTKELSRSSRSIGEDIFEFRYRNSGINYEEVCLFLYSP